jgi:DNA-binding response OmpR family regulator
VATVLLLEEDGTVADFVRNTLISRGHGVRTCENLGDLVDRLADGADLVISDAGLEFPPQQVLAAVSAACPGTPTLLTTTFLEPLEERLLLEMGADAVLHKPFDLPSFLTLVDILTTRRARRPVRDRIAHAPR